jgi:hypothetical protein
MNKTLALGALLLPAAFLVAAERVNHDYRVLATNRTSTMEKEMNEAAAAGYSFQAVMGGETAFGGKEVLVVMGKSPAADAAAHRQYKLLATSRTSTMQKELQQAADDGFVYRGQTVFESTFGGKELNEAAAAGFRLVGLTVGKTALGGNEVVSILNRTEE